MYLVLAFLLTNEWERLTKIDPMWNYTEETLSLKSTADHDDLTLHLSLRKRGLSIYVSTDRILGVNNVEVTYRFDSEKPTVRTWLASDDATAAFVPNRNRDRILSALLDAKKMMFQVRPHQGGPLNAVFELGDFRNVIETKTENRDWNKILDRMDRIAAMRKRIKAAHAAENEIKAKKEAERLAKLAEVAKQKEKLIANRIKLEPGDLGDKSIWQESGPTLGWDSVETSRYEDGEVQSVTFLSGGRHLPEVDFRKWMQDSGLPLRLSPSGDINSLGRQSVNDERIGAVEASGIVNAIGASITNFTVYYQSRKVQQLDDWPCKITKVLRKKRKQLECISINESDHIESPLNWSSGKIDWYQSTLYGITFTMLPGRAPDLKETLRWLETGGIKLDVSDFDETGKRLVIKDKARPKRIRELTIKKNGTLITELRIFASLEI